MIYIPYYGSSTVMVLLGVYAVSVPLGVCAVNVLLGVCAFNVLPARTVIITPASLVEKSPAWGVGISQYYIHSIPTFFGVNL